MEYREPTPNEVELVGLIPSFVLVAREHLQHKTNDEVAAWINSQLQIMGYDSSPVGAKHCHLKRTKVK